MTPSAISFLAGLVGERARIVPSADKTYLLSSRLLPVARAHGFVSPEELVEALERGPRDISLEDEVVAALDTGSAGFFRDRASFDAFEADVLPELIEARAAGRRLRLWCAGTRGGQEAYSLALLLRERAELEGWRVEIVATDPDAELLEKARAGLYSQFEVRQGLPVRLLVRHFDRRGEMWQVDAQVRAMLRFQRLDPARPGGLGPFDAAFFRDVLGRVAADERPAVLERVAGQIATDGVLVLGSGETTLGITDLFAAAGADGIFRKTVSEDARRPAA